MLFSSAYFLFLMSVSKEKALIKMVNAESDKSLPNFIPIFFHAKGVKAFTIEKVDTCYSSKTLCLPVVISIIMKIRSMLGLADTARIRNLEECAIRLAIFEMRALCIGASYIVNAHLKLSWINRSTVRATMQGTALYKYKDTLPIFLVNHLKARHMDILTYSRSNISLLVGSAVYCSYIILTIALWNALNTYYAKHMSKEVELRLWSYIQEEIDEMRANQIDMISAARELTSISEELSDEESEYTMKIHIIEQDKPGIYLYPDANIVISSGIVRNITTRNQALFLLAHMMEHYNKRDHLTSLGNDLITLYILGSMNKMKWLASLLVWRRDFWSVYNDELEVQADYFALEKLRKLHNNLSGASAFLEVDGKRKSDLALMHPMSASRIAQLEEYTKTHHLPSTQDIPFTIQSPTQQDYYGNIHSSTLEYPLTTNSLITNHAIEIGALWGEYSKFLSKFDNFATFSSSITLEGLKQRERIVHKANTEVARYRDSAFEISDKYDTLISKSLDSMEAGMTKNVFAERWAHEKSYTASLAKFYYLRDKKLFRAYELLLSFLITRYGSIKWTGGRPEFSTPKEKSDYLSLLQNIESIANMKHN